jgi:hypothetical protein
MSVPNAHPCALILIFAVPILGDSLYDHHSGAMPSHQPVLASPIVLPDNRLFLHSSSISFWVKVFFFFFFLSGLLQKVVES